MGKKKRKLQDSPRADIGAEIAPSSPDTLGGQTPQPPQYISPPDYDPLNDDSIAPANTARGVSGGVSIPLHADPIIPDPTYSFTGGQGQRSGATVPSYNAPDFGQDVPDSALLAAWGTTTPSPDVVSAFQSSYNQNLSPDARYLAIPVTGITDAKTLAAMGVPGFGADGSQSVVTNQAVVDAAHHMQASSQDAASTNAFQAAWNAAGGSPTLPVTGTLDDASSTAFRSVIVKDLTNPSSGVEAANTSLQAVMAPTAMDSVKLFVGVGLFLGLLYIITKIPTQNSEVTGRNTLYY